MADFAATVVQLLPLVPARLAQWLDQDLLKPRLQLLSQTEPLYQLLVLET